MGCGCLLSWIHRSSRYWAYVSHANLTSWWSSKARVARATSSLGESTLLCSMLRFTGGCWWLTKKGQPISLQELHIKIAAVQPHLFQSQQLFSFFLAIRWFFEGGRRIWWTIAIAIVHGLLCNSAQYWFHEYYVTIVTNSNHTNWCWYFANGRKLLIIRSIRVGQQNKSQRKDLLTTSPSCWIWTEYHNLPDYSLYTPLVDYHSTVHGFLHHYCVSYCWPWTINLHYHPSFAMITFNHYKP